MKIGYPGSKAGAGVWQRIISLMPVHQNYFELFLGHGAVMLRKRPAPGINVGCDVDPDVIAWWRRKLARRSTSSPAMTILEQDALQILTSHPAMNNPQTLVYLDPPYLRSTRTRRLYDHEFDSDAQHRRLLKIINRLDCMVMISGYRSDLYDQELLAWTMIPYRAMTRGGVREERLWLNFKHEGLELHDCRFVGEGFRERERIGRKRDRWRRRFENMPPAERQVIAEALAAVS